MQRLTESLYLRQLSLRRRHQHRFSFLRERNRYRNESSLGHATLPRAQLDPTERATV